jgi:RNA polymerase sigma-70 factor, ECF subfamily
MQQHQVVHEFFVRTEKQLMPRHVNFANSVAQHLPYLTRMARGLTRDDSLTEDLVQQTILKALVHGDQFRCESTLKTWLTSIARNEFYQSYRCEWRRRAVPLVTEHVDGYGVLQVDSLSPAYEAKEREAVVREAVSRLPQSYRSVVELCDLQCLSLQEAAAKLQLTLAAVKTRRQRARRKLLRFVVNLRRSDSR